MSSIDDLFRQQQEALEHYDEVWRRILSQAEARALSNEARALSNPEFEFECEEEEQTTEGYTDE